MNTQATRWLVFDPEAPLFGPSGFREVVAASREEAILASKYRGAWRAEQMIDVADKKQSAPTRRDCNDDNTGKVG